MEDLRSYEEYVELLRCFNPQSDNVTKFWLTWVPYCVMFGEWEPISRVEVPKVVVEVDIPMSVARTWFNWDSKKPGWKIKVHMFLRSLMNNVDKTSEVEKTLQEFLQSSKWDINMLHRKNEKINYRDLVKPDDNADDNEPAKKGNRMKLSLRKRHKTELFTFRRRVVCSHKGCSSSMLVSSSENITTDLPGKLKVRLEFHSIFIFVQAQINFKFLILRKSLSLELSICTAS